MLYSLTWPLMKRFMHCVFLYLGGFRRDGLENVPRRGGVLICPNHCSDADGPAIAVAMPRDAHYMAKQEILDTPILGTLGRLWHVFPIQRDTADLRALRHAEKLLRAGEAVVIYPEGGGNAENTLQPLHAGPLLLALRCNVPVIPAAIFNSGKVWTYGAPKPHRAGVPVIVTFGEPLDLSRLKGKRGAVEAATRLLTETLADMLGQPVPEGKPVRRD